ncbi:MFS transporter [Paenibacillus sp.]|uniref:MFS transporter n=1 Tax=Paenibacillus sp. TaxID=58172 RepID=UPI002D371704|nr:MFS transporter [Paenibacillus sp.]HZG88459.1 MFS transporter [Paenibacillus sp.]
MSQPQYTLQMKKGLSRGAVTSIYLLGIFMGAIDHGIVGPALSSILEAFGVNAQWGVWSFTIYTLLFAVSIPVLGKLSDRFGRKQTFQFGIALFALGSIIAAFATSFPMFLLGRAVQAVGTGGIFPITGAQIAMSYPPEQRGKMMGLIGMVFGLGTILGPILGGVMLERLAWQWIFLINVPISILILFGTTAIRQEQQQIRKPIDVLGILVLAGAILSLMLGITLKNGYFLAALLVWIPLLVIVERKSIDPVMNLQYFTRSRTLVLLASSSISGFVMASATNMIPFFSETVLGMSKGEAGMSVAPLAAASVAASLAGGFLVDKVGAKRVLLLGFGITLAAGAVLASDISSLAVFYPLIAAMGFGIGIVIGAPLNVLMLQAVDPKETGAAVGYISLFRSMGSTLGPTMAGLFLALYPNGFAVLFLTSSIVSAVSVVLLLLFLRGKVQTQRG